MGKAARAKAAPYTLFVSHGWEDRWIARQMAEQAVAKAGASIFIDVFDIATGDRIAERVRTGLSRCTELVALLTPRSAGRSWVWTEIGGAWTAGKRVVGVLHGLSLDDIRQDYGGTACLDGVSCIELNDFDAYLEDLAARVKASPGGKG